MTSKQSTNAAVIRRFIEAFTPGLKPADPTPFPTAEQALAALRELEREASNQDQPDLEGGAQNSRYRSYDEFPPSRTSNQETREDA